MNFKPVEGAELRDFDDETRKLYMKRVSDERLTTALMKLNRNTDRNYLPVISSEPTQFELDKKAYLASFPYKIVGAIAFFSFAMHQFSKAYFPFGIILRRSIPTNMAQQLAYRAPIGIVFAYAWYKQREYPRQFRSDLTCDSEN